jgi:hypothetical protein
MEAVVRSNKFSVVVYNNNKPIERITLIPGVPIKRYDDNNISRLEKSIIKKLSKVKNNIIINKLIN